MSRVSGIVLVHSCCEIENDEESLCQPLIEINSWLAKHDFDHLADVTEYASGTKHPQCNVFCAGYNYFPEDEFVEFVLSRKWELPENLVLMIDPEEGPTKVFQGGMKGGAECQSFSC